VTGQTPRTPRGRAGLVGRLLIAVGPAILAVALRLLPGPQITDDAYITFKYVRNLASGLGFTYNPGEHVLGTTTPLYTLSLTGLYLLLGRLGASIITISYVLNAILEGANTALLAKLARRATGSRAVGAACGLLSAVSSVAIAVSLSGMETPLYVLLILSTLLLFLSGRTPAAAVVCALAVLTRPDGLLLALALLAYLLVRERRQLPRVIALGSFVLAPWLIFSSLYFGSPIATSVAAKNVVYLLPRFEALRGLAHHWCALVGLDLTGPPAYAPAAALTVLWLLGTLSVARRGRRFGPVAIFPLLYLCAFAIANKPMFRWYYVPLEPFYLLGLAGLAQALLKVRATRYAAATLTAAVVMAVVGAQLYSLNLLPDASRPWLTPKRISLERELLYQRVAEDINRSYPVDSGVTIATPEIGAFGYYSRARILDTTGLVSPEALRYYPLDPALSPECNYAVAPDMIRELKPEMVVSLELFIRNGLLPDPWFRSHYTPAARYDTEAFGSKGLLVFRRRDWALPSGWGDRSGGAASGAER